MRQDGGYVGDSFCAHHANGVRDLSRQEQQTLLREAGKLIRTYRQIASFSQAGSPTVDLDLAHELEQFAEHIDFKYANEAKNIMLKAADDIQTGSDQTSTLSGSFNAPGS